MPYTLMKGLVWVLLAVVLGIVIGWLLRSVAAKRQVDRARAQQGDDAELERLRGRLTNLESVVVERDRLKEELEASRAAGSDLSTASSGLSSEVQGLAAVSAADQGVADQADETAPEHDDGPEPAAAPDVDGAAAVLGRSITLDDLKVIEGIGPKIEELCNGIGIRTWFDLSTTEASLLRTMLADAGSRFRSHDPATWPEQAGLLAAGRWEEFVALTDALSGGRAVD
jgi:predicted flap endonuclease-1-like 5' DNA nuclease